MSRVTLDLSHLGVALRPQLIARARYALQLYRRVPRRSDAPDYPFARRPEDGSVRDPGAARITPIPNGIRIAVQSRGAYFEEHGNDAGGRYIQAKAGGELRLPLRSTRRARGPGHSGRGKVIIGGDGRAYLAVQRVRTYRGKHLLERSVRYAFTGRSGLRGGPSTR